MLWPTFAACSHAGRLAPIGSRALSATWRRPFAFTNVPEASAQEQAGSTVSAATAGAAGTAGVTGCGRGFGFGLGFGGGGCGDAW